MKDSVRSEIKKAIDREKRAYELYIGLYRKSPNANVQALFNTLAIEELKHEAMLKEALRGGDLLEAQEKIFSRHDELSIKEKINPNVDMQGLREAMELALGKEHKAMQKYLELKGKAQDPQLRDIFSFLAGEEERHGMLIRNELSKL
jgi:rubrerythrin